MSHDLTEARSLQGRLSLTFERAGDRTVVRKVERTPPLHVQRPLSLDPERPALAHLALLNSTAGLFAGDSHRLDIRVESAAAVALTTPAMTRIFRTPAGHADIATRAEVATGGYLEYFPEATLLCGGARLHQSTDLSLAAGATVAWGELLAFGRTSHGEDPAACELQQRLHVYHNNELVLAEALTLSPEEPSGTPGVLHRYSVLGTLLLFGEARVLDSLLVQVRGAFPAGAPTAIAATRLLGGAGIGVRALGSSAWEVQRALRVALDAFRACCFPRSHPL